MADTAASAKLFDRQLLAADPTLGTDSSLRLVEHPTIQSKYVPRPPARMFEVTADATIE